MSVEAGAVARRNLAASRLGLTEQVQDAIVDLLLEGAIPEDSPIRIDVLAHELGVSATPVREALARLEGTGVVIRVNYKGYRTAPRLSPKELGDLMDLRTLLEPEAARLACLRGGDHLLAELESALREQEASLELTGAEGFRAFMRADQRFHRIIHSHSDNRFLASAADALGGNIQRWRQFENMVITDADDSLAEHREILRAFQTGDPLAVEATMRRHLDNLKSRMGCA